MKYLVLCSFFLNLLAFSFPGGALAQDARKFKLSATQAYQPRDLTGKWKVFQYELTISADNNSSRLVGKIVRVPGDDPSGYKLGTNMFIDGVEQADVYAVQWVNHGGDDNHHIITTTPATINLNQDSFEIRGRKAVPSCQTFIPDPTRTRNWRWTSELGKPFHYTFHRANE